MSVLAQHKTDAIFRIQNLDRYDSRDVASTIVSNFLMHHDFSSGYVVKLVIEKDKLHTESDSLSYGYGALNLATFDLF